ncbi:MAG: hypothetical protein Q7U04_07235 [Bacteriovorax sp.]|nr:hypothetical protein [Bacteriovorax sp.]
MKKIDEILSSLAIDSNAKVPSFSELKSYLIEQHDRRKKLRA